MAHKYFSYNYFLICNESCEERIKNAGGRSGKTESKRPGCVPGFSIPAFRHSSVPCFSTSRLICDETAVRRVDDML